MAPNTKDASIYSSKVYVAEDPTGLLPTELQNGVITNGKHANGHFEHEDDKDTEKSEIVWRNVILFIYLHIASVYGLYLAVTEANWRTNVFAFMLHFFGGLGITAGAHRLWAHKSYRAKLPLRIVLAIFNTIAFQNDLYEWSRDHRVHHKFSETDADPHNATRGFFFSHMGWLLVRKHRDVREKGKTVDLTDLEQDSVVMFQKRHYVKLVILMCFLMPAFIPWYFWGEKVSTAYYVCSMLRYLITLHSTWLVNSAAHMWGFKPYDKRINPSENWFVALGACGEGWHNYHHTFPWDYSTSELGWKINLTTIVIDVFAKIGWAYDRKTVPREIVLNRMNKFGDGTFHGHGLHPHSH